MLLLKLTVCSLLIVAFADEDEPKSVPAEDDQKKFKCSTDCEEGVTAEGDDIKVICQWTYSDGSKPALTWHNEKDGSEVEGIVPQTKEEDGTVVLEFSKKADASGVAPLFCKAAIPGAEDDWCVTKECDISSTPTIAISVGVVVGVVVTAIIGGLAYKFGYKKEG